MRRVSRRKNVRRKFVSRGRRMQSQTTMPLYYRRKSAMALSQRLRGAVSRGFKRRGQPASTTSVKRRRSVSAPVNVMQQLSKSKKSVRMQNYKLSRVVNATINQKIDRFQRISNFDTNVGALFCSNASNGAATYLPMIIIDLGSIEQLIGGVVSRAPNVYSAQWSDQTVNASINLIPEGGSNPDGSFTGQTYFQPEDNNDKLPFTAETYSTALLDWVNIRANLYGQRNRTTKFVITVFQITDDEVCPVSGSASNLDKKALFQYLERPFIYSNLQQDNIKKKTGYKVIKEFTYNIQPMTTIDLNTITGNIHEANIHLKINKRMDYSYTRNVDQIIPHGIEDGQDWTLTGVDGTTGTTKTIHNLPKPKQNVYVSIRAFAPIRTGIEVRSAADSPSVDLLVRRGMTFSQ